MNGNGTGGRGSGTMAIALLFGFVLSSVVSFLAMVVAWIVLKDDGGDDDDDTPPPKPLADDTTISPDAKHRQATGGLQPKALSGLRGSPVNPPKSNTETKSNTPPKPPPNPSSNRMAPIKYNTTLPPNKNQRFGQY